MYTPSVLEEIVTVYDSWRFGQIRTLGSTLADAVKNPAGQ
jgi:hypothetical protein